MALTDYLSASGWMRRSQRRDDAVVRWLQDNPDTYDLEIADGLRRPVRATHRRLLRLEREGRVTSQWVGDDFFNYLVYRPATHDTAPRG